LDGRAGFVFRDLVAVSPIKVRANLQFCVYIACH
jgi:hypothetical protein